MAEVKFDDSVYDAIFATEVTGDDIYVGILKGSGKLATT